MNIKSAIKHFVFGEEEMKREETEGKLHIVSPNGKAEVIIRFSNGEDFNRVKGDAISLITNSLSEDVYL